MTLNDHFALKSVSGSATNELAFSDFGTKLFENLKSYLYTVSDKNVAQGSYSFWQGKICVNIRWGLLDRRRQMTVGSS